MRYLIIFLLTKVIQNFIKHGRRFLDPRELIPDPIGIFNVASFV